MSSPAKNIPLRLPKSIHAAGRRHARRQGLAFPEYIRRLIRRDLGRTGSPNPPAKNNSNPLRDSVLHEESGTSNPPWITIREADSTAQVRALSEGRAPRRSLSAAPLQEARLRPVSPPVEWLFAVRLPRRSVCGKKTRNSRRPHGSAGREAKP
jgi:hypothetical protein